MTYPPGHWVPAAADASTRRYFRGVFNGREAFLADFGEDSDGLQRFLHVQRLFSREGIGVPEVLEACPKEAWLVLSWVDGAVLSKARWRRDFEGQLLEIARRVAAIAEWDEGPALLELDGPRMSFELAFFRVHCLEGFLNLPSPPGLADALGALAEQAAGFARTLAHRDFHSENILVGKHGALVLTDFQDALMAPRCYDAASLAVDAYRDQSPVIRQGFQEQWIALAGVPPGEFEATALQRALKALGTFGYQVTRRKRARYLKFLAPQAAHALAFLDAAPVSLECLRPALEGLARS
jgi:N-acetylmuramate 1-kinase